jgi:cytoskeletal protein CcmA (bactofilin family)
MQNLKIDGAAKIAGGEYGILTVDGMATCLGDITAETMSADGMLKCEGDVKAGTLQCDGMTKIRGNLKAGRIDVDGMLKVSGSKIEADEIECDGMIKIDGEISADVIKADGCIDAEEITGDSIYVRSHRHFALPFFRRTGSRIKLIEATTVELRGVAAESVNGKDVRIGRGCRIANVDCSGTLWISPWAHVGNVTGDYASVDE